MKLQFQVVQVKHAPQQNGFKLRYEAGTGTDQQTANRKRYAIFYPQGGHSQKSVCQIFSTAAFEQPLFAVAMLTS